MDAISAEERRQIEIELLQAMYPDQVKFDLKAGELKYTADAGGTIVLRLPEQYPERGLPELIAAADQAKNDFRLHMRAALNDMRLLPGEEILDAVIQAFEEVLVAHADHGLDTPARAHDADQGEQRCEWKTVVIWLHHLLNTNKRKLALNPTVGAASSRNGGVVSGMTKPGYPGILVYSGPSDLVDAHVTELRAQRWQAFQVRYEQVYDQSKMWQFGHGEGIIEVESMSDVAQGITNEANREKFLQAAGIK